MILADVAEAFRHGPRALLQDLRLEARPWGLALEKVRCPVSLWHGSRDETVPQRASEALATMLPGASLKIFPEAGHFFFFDIWGEILGWLVS